MDQSALISLAAGALPTVVISIIGFFSRRAFDDARHGVQELKAALESVLVKLETLSRTVSSQDTRMAVMEQRMAHIETQRLPRLEEEHLSFRERLHTIYDSLPPEKLAFGNLLSGKRSRK